MQPFLNSKRHNVAPTCPCGKSNKDGKYAPFKGRSGGGYCHSCGTYFPPKGEVDKEYTGEPSWVNYLREEPKRFVDYNIIKKTFREYEYNNFYTWFRGVVGVADCQRIFKYFSIGTAKFRSTIFWYQDINGRWLTGKRMRYRMSGQRNKDVHPCYLFKSSDGYSNCFFGEFQLRFYPQSYPVNILESEKSVALSFWRFPDQIWIASGGSNGCTKDKAAILRNRTVRIFNDMDDAGRQGVQRACRNFKKLGVPATMVDLEKDRTDGADIGDLILENL